MTSAKHLSRATALAIYVGLGAAVATGGVAVASADTGETASSASATSSESSGEAGPARKTTKRSNLSASEHTATGSAGTGQDADDTAPADEESRTDSEEDPGDSTESDTGATDEDASVPNEAAAEDAANAPVDNSHSAESTDSFVQQPGPAESSDVVVVPPAAVDPAPAAESAGVPNATNPAPAGTSVQRSETATNADEDSAPGTGIVSRLLSVLGLALPQSAVENPVTPATPSLLAGIGDAIRRELERFFHNDLPIPDPRQVVQGTGTGVVVGTMNTTDEENDRLSFIVTDQPKYGRVTVYSDGSWVYTPNRNIAANLAATGWTDSFNIRVIDRGFNLRKVQDFLRGDAPGVSLPVSVTVAGYTGTSSGQTPSLPAGAAAGAMSASATVTKRLEVVNASSRPIKLVSYGDHAQNQVTASPEVGAILQPGEKHEFDVVYYFLGLGQVNPVYSTLDGAATWKVKMTVQPFSDTQSSCQVNGAGTCNKYGSPIVMMDQPGGRIEIPAGQGQKQADALNLLCKSGTPASCSFSAKQQDKNAYAVEREIWSVQTAESKTDVKRTLEFTNSTSHSVEIGAKAGITIKAIVEAEISAKYTAKLEETVKNSTTIESTVPPWTRKVLLAEQPVTRYTGDFTVKLGNTTYYLRDVYFDVPDSTRAVRYRETSTPVAH